MHAQSEQSHRLVYLAGYYWFLLLGDYTLDPRFYSLRYGSRNTFVCGKSKKISMSRWYFLLRWFFFFFFASVIEKLFNYVITYAPLSWFIKRPRYDKKKKKRVVRASPIRIVFRLDSRKRRFYESDRLCLWFRMRVDQISLCYDNESREVQQV